jgi:sugar/nucleoside kinase (ribokinase family)
VPKGSVGVPIRLADPTALSLVRPGNRVDLLRVDARRQPTAVAAAALVLNVTGAGDPTTGGLLLALTPAEAQQAVTGSDNGFAIVIRPG